MDFDLNTSTTEDIKSLPVIRLHIHLFNDDCGVYTSKKTKQITTVAFILTFSSVQVSLNHWEGGMKQKIVNQFIG